MDENIRKIYDLLNENKHNLALSNLREDSYDTHAQGYNDAILDVLAIFGEKPEEDH